MADLFLFGTLRHLPLLELVLGRGVSEDELIPAQLPGYAVSRVQNEGFPMIALDPAAEADGLVHLDLSADDVARLDFYEGCFAYDLSPVTLKSGQAAQAYMPRPDLWQAAGPWSLETWVRTYAEISLTAAREVMGYFGQRSSAEVGRMYGMILARAASVARAAQSRHGSDAFRGEIEVVRRTRTYADFFALDDLEVRHARYDGTMSDTLDRGVFIAADAAFVLPYDPVRDCVLVIEQVRMGPILRGDPTCWHMEAIAGRVDPGEAPEEAARREALEEAGLTLGALEQIAEIYPTAGSSTEFFFVYLGIADLPDGAAQKGGLATEHEDIRGHIWSFEELMDRVRRFDVVNAVLVTSAYYLAHHRDRLRSAGPGARP